MCPYQLIYSDPASVSADILGSLSEQRRPLSPALSKHSSDKFRVPSNRLHML
jgi:hypothetical protein